MSDAIKQYKDMTPTERRAFKAKMHSDEFNRENDTRNAADLAATQRRIDNSKEKAK